MAVTYRVVVRDLAVADLDDAAAYFKGIDSDLAKRFLDDFERTTRRLDRFPFVGRQPYRGVHRIGLDVFPYHVYYRVVGQEVRIIAVLHNRRDPKTLQTVAAARH